MVTRSFSLNIDNPIDRAIQDVIYIAPRASDQKIKSNLRVDPMRVSHVRKLISDRSDYNYARAVAKSTSDRIRFESQVEETDSCWEWVGLRSSENYGTFYLNRTYVRAHRFAFELVHGPIPAGHVICHRCDNPPCVNPAHLFSGTQKDNMQDMVAKGRKANWRDPNRPPSAWPAKPGRRD